LDHKREKCPTNGRGTNEIFKSPIWTYSQRNLHQKQSENIQHDRRCESASGKLVRLPATIGHESNNQDRLFSANVRFDGTYDDLEEDGKPENTSKFKGLGSRT
jgi:hypothetical protein